MHKAYEDRKQTVNKPSVQTAAKLTKALGVSSIENLIK
jgi:hypothetical protein